MYSQLVGLCLVLNSIKCEIYVQFSRGLIQRDIQHLPTYVTSRRQYVLKKKLCPKLNYVLSFGLLCAQQSEGNEGNVFRVGNWRTTRVTLWLSVQTLFQ